ncbi:MAG: DUF748 domain-containing protein [Tepidisphaeraceae bacterium]
MPESENAESKPKPKRLHVWRRRLAVLTLTIVFVGIGFRLLLALMLRVLITWAAHSAGYDVQYNSLSLSLLGGDASLTDLRLKPRDGADADQILRAEYVRAKIFPLRMLRLQLVADRVEADGVRIDATRLPDGSIPLLKNIAGSNKPDPNARPTELNFDSPLIVYALRLNRIALKIRDETVSPAFEETVSVNAAVSEIGMVDRPAKIELLVGSNQLIDSLRVTGDAAANGAKLDSNIDFEVRGFRPDRAAPYLASLGISANDRNLDAHGKATLKLNAIPKQPGALSGDVQISNVDLVAGRDTVAQLDRAAIDVAIVSPSQLHVRTVDVAGGNLHLQRSREGLRFAAFMPSTTPATHPTSRTVVIAAPPTTRQVVTTPFEWQVDKVTVAGLKASLDDYVVLPQTTLEIDVNKVQVDGVKSSGKPEDAVNVVAELAAPRIAGVISVKANAQPFAAKPAAQFDLVVDKIRPDAVTPYLTPIGVTHTFESGKLTVAANATIDRAGPDPRVDLNVDTVSLTDRGISLFELSGIRVTGFRIESNSGAIIADEVKGSGPKLTLHRTLDGTIEVPGLRYKAPIVNVEPTGIVVHREGPVVVPTTQPALRLPPIRVAKLTWGGVDIKFENEMPAGVLDTFQIADAGAEVTDFVFDPRENAPPAKPGTIKVWMKSPGFVESFDASGTLTPATGEVVATLDLAGRGMKLTRLTPYLQTVGIEPHIAAGTVDGKLMLLMRQREQDEGLTLSTYVEKFAFKDAGRELLSAGLLGFDWILISPGSIQAGELWAMSPKLNVERAADGSLLAAGIRYVPPKQAKPSKPFEPFDTIHSLGLITINHLHLKDAVLGWTDAAVSPAVTTQLRAEAQLSNLGVNTPTDQVAYYWAKLAVDNAASSLYVQGQLLPGRDTLTASGIVRGEGLSGKALAPYIPPGQTLVLNNASLKVDYDATLKKNPAGGYSANAAVRGLDYREADAAVPFAAMTSLDVVVDRYDPADAVIAVKKLVVDGLEAQVARSPNGHLDVLGLRVGPAPAGINANPEAQAAANVNDIVAAAKQQFPLVSIDELNVGVKQLRFTDGVRPQSAPVSIENLKLQATSPIRVLGPDPQANEPVKLTVDGSISPAVGKFDVSLLALPFKDKPHIEVDLNAKGIHADGVLAIVPELKGLLDGAHMPDGQFKTHLDADATVRRRGPVVIELSRGIDISFTMTGTELRDGATGPVLAGVEQVHGENVKIDVIGGGIVAKLIEVTNVKGYAWRDQAGIHVLGFAIKPPSSGDSSSQPTPPAEPAPTAVADSGPEMRINRLLVTGADLTFEDRMVDPVVIIPINALEADIRGLSSLVLSQDKPFKFNISAGAGKVSLPGKRDKAKFEDREFFGQATAFGEMAIVPTLRGRGVFAINGLELNALRGVASAYGAGLSDGTFDARAELRSRDDNSMDVRSKLVFTDLEYSEPVNGVIQRAIKAPTSINDAIFVLRGADGSINLPVDFNFKPGRDPVGDIIGGAIPPVLGQIAVGMVSLPAKMLGLGGGPKATDTVEDPPISIPFTTGLVGLTSEQRDQLARLTLAAKDPNVSMTISQKIGADDMTIARDRANPPLGRAAALASDLRRRRAELLDQRYQLISAARAQAVGATETIGGESLQQLASVQSELADVEDAFDALYDLQRPGAEKQADRRGKSAALFLLTARQDALDKFLRRLADADTLSRIIRNAPRIDLADGAQSELVIVVKRKVKK